MTDFAALIGSIARDGAAYRIVIPEDWQQGRTTYGGLAAAICVESALRQFTDLPPLRSAQFSFIGPATGTLSARPQMLRRGKSTAFISVDLSGDAGLASRATLCFAATRSSKLHRPASAAPTVMHWEDAPSFFGEWKAANFVQHFDCRKVGGGHPCGGSEDLTYLAWLHHNGAAPASVTSLIALADVLPPAAMVLLKQFAPLSTMTWTIDLLTEDPRSEEGWWLLHNQADDAVEGYSTQAMTIWNAHGEAVAIGRQNIAIFV